ncbi:RluA family pseudouridine synthase [Desulfopila sp. IMCC35008]|uniref:RluA family pseudouridine synthase n=1 Tax=Desulfopila sp. IMCC35008 TaxID=2653858 RepID=UPI0013D713A3|nr:RNA pseudouridine synthase [Desulfopila sp. IMCC35008]
MKFQKRIKVTKTALLIDLLASHCDASKSSLKDCLTKGGVWRKGVGKKELRVRRAKSQVTKGDIITVCYDDTILKRNPPPVQPLVINNHYSIWNKPALLLSQGSRFGDHCSLLRVAGKTLKTHKPYLVHRLDREACGLVILAHGKLAAGKFSELFKKRQIVKRYLAVVRGLLAAPGKDGSITEPLDGKSALTEYHVLHQENNKTVIQVEIKTGRYHQIRKHFSGIGHPLVGDKRYDSKEAEVELHLAACELSFTCPFDRIERNYTLGKKEISFAENYF